VLKYSELRSGARADLNAGPLEKPFTVYIEPTNVCNFRCSMCPESLPDYHGRAGHHGSMSETTFSRILESLEAWKPIRSLKFYFVGEPLLNLALPFWIQRAQKFGLAERYELTTNLSILTRSIASGLVHCGLDYIRISVYEVDDERHQSVTASRFTASTVRRNARMLRTLRDEVKRPGWPVPYLYAQYFGENQTFRDLWGPIVDEMGIEPLHNWAGDLVQIGGETAKQPCPAPFYMLAIRANGDVSPCCVDWSGALTLGNVNQTSLQDLWTGPRMLALRMAQIHGRRGDVPACAGCTASFPDKMRVIANE
jgi:radical SAM protein with 4Fe4S-binding SPASM domain